MKKSLNILMATMMLLLLVSCNESESNQNNNTDTASNTEDLFMVNNKLYYGTDEIGPMGDSGSVEGEIISSVENTETPSRNAESNFGCIGNPYTYDFGDSWIMVLMGDDEYHIFYEKNINE